jgi:DNA-binding Lrp family transcriptional regulator
LNRVDRAIVRALWEDPQMPNTRLAERVGVSELTIAARLDALVRDKLIKITVQRDIRTLGMSVMGIVEVWLEKRDAFEVGAVMGEIGNVLSVTVALGQPQLIVMMMAQSIGEFLHVMETQISTVSGVSKTVASLSLEVISFRPGIVSLP